MKTGEPDVALIQVRPRVLRLQIVLLLVVGTVLFPNLALAHSPHDEVVRVILTGGLRDLPLILLAIVRGMAIVSTQGGSCWSRISGKTWRGSIIDADADHQVLWLGAKNRVFQIDLPALAMGKTIVLTELEIPAPLSRIRIKAGKPYVHCTDGCLYEYNGASWVKLGSSVRAIGTDCAHERLIVLQSDPSNTFVDTNIIGCCLDTVIKPACATFCAVSGIILIGGDTGLYAIENCDQNSTQSKPALHLLKDATTSVYAGQSCLLVTLRNDGVAYSKNHGESWRVSTDGLTKDAQADSPGFGVPHFYDSVLNEKSGQIYVAGFDGLFVSSDHSSRFQELLGVLPRTLVTGVAKLISMDAFAVSTYGSGHVRYVQSSPDRILPECHSRESPRGYGLVEGIDGSGQSVVLSNDSSNPLMSHDAGLTWAPCPYQKINAPDRSPQRVLKAHVGSILRKVVGYSEIVWPNNPATQLRRRLSLKRMAQPIATRIPFFGTRIVYSVKFESDDTVFIGSRSSGVYRSRDRGRSWSQVLSLPNQELRGIECVLPTASDLPLLIILTKSGTIVSEDMGETFTTNERTAAGNRDVSCSFINRVYVATATGLYWTDDGVNWHIKTVLENQPTYACAACVSVDQRLLVQLDDGSVYVTADGEAFHCLADVGLPIFRQGVEFPDLAPMMTLLDDNEVVGSDQYALYAIKDKQVRRLPVSMRVPMSVPEIHTQGRWVRLPRRSLIGTQSMYGYQGTLVYTFEGYCVRVMGMASPNAELSCSVSCSDSAEGIKMNNAQVNSRFCSIGKLENTHVLWQSEILPETLNQLTIHIRNGKVRLDALEILGL